jgi:hypothetical protein
MNVYKHSQNCATVAAGIVAKWNCFDLRADWNPVASGTVAFADWKPVAPSSNEYTAKLTSLLRFASIGIYL